MGTDDVQDARGRGKGGGGVSEQDNEPNHTSIAADLFMLCAFVALIVALSADSAPVGYDPRFIDREYVAPTTRTERATAHDRSETDG